MTKTLNGVSRSGSENADKVSKDVEYIKNHPLLFEDKDNSNSDDSKEKKS